MAKCNIALIGVSGFGELHLDVIGKLENEKRLSLIAICDKNADPSNVKIRNLVSKGVKYYSDYNVLLEEEEHLDFVVISTPIHLHKRMAIDAMEKGVNVLLEKPPAATFQDVESIIAVSRKTGEKCAADFLLTSGKAFLELEGVLNRNLLGEINSIIGIGLWKRLDSYYDRTPWAGKLVYDGRYVLDGTMNNPLAHMLNNMLFLSCASRNDKVACVTAELYHAHNIDGEDTSCLRIEMDNGIKLYYYATLCNEDQETPYIIVEGTKGRAVWNYSNELVVECESNAFYKKFDSENYMENIYNNLIDILNDIGKELFCPIEKTRNFMLATNGAFDSSCLIHSIPPEFILRKDDEDSTATCIKNIKDIILKAADEKKLFSEIGVPWAIPGRRFNMENYHEFKMFTECTLK